jgi:hypothetical protein
MSSESNTQTESHSGYKNPTREMSDVLSLLSKQVDRLEVPMNERGEREVSGYLATKYGSSPFEDPWLIKDEALEQELPRLDGRILQYVNFGVDDSGRHLTLSPGRVNAGLLLDEDGHFNKKLLDQVTSVGDDQGAGKIELYDGLEGPAINAYGPDFVQYVDSAFPGEVPLLHSIHRAATQIKLATPVGWETHTP